MPYPQKIDFIKLLLTLSKTLDLGTSGLTRHHQMVALASMKMASLLGLRRDEKEDLFCSAIIHDIGVSTSAEKARIMDIDYDAVNHAIVGWTRLKESPILFPYAETVKHHHDRWDGSNIGLKGEDIPLNSRIIHLVDRMTFIIKNDKPVIGQETEIIKQIERLSGKFFQPLLVKCIKELIMEESFLLDITSDFLPNLINNYAPSIIREVDLDGLMSIAGIFAHVIDNKSTYTMRHSLNIANISVWLAKRIGFSEKELKMVEIASLLHDIGKLSVPDEVLEKPGRLSPEEFNIMRGHTYFTFHILNSIDEFDTISEWAAFHHEKLNGRGYPFHLKEGQLSIGSRIMAVSDKFSALSEDRPYRKSLTNNEIIANLNIMVDSGDIDGKIVKILKEEIEEIRGLINKEV